MSKIKCSVNGLLGPRMMCHCITVGGEFCGKPANQCEHQVEVTVKANAFTQRKPLDPAFVKDVKRTAQRKDAAVKNVAKHGEKITLSIKERK